MSPTESPEDPDPADRPPRTSPPWSPEKPELRPELAHPAPGLINPAAPDDGTRTYRRSEELSDDQRARRKRRRTVVVSLGITALVAGSIIAVVASRQDDPEYAQVCFNDAGERVDDVNCGSEDGRGSGIYAWYFYARGASVPAIGQNRSSYPSYTTSRPSNAKPATGFTSKGGTVSRGGFGGSGGSGSHGSSGG
ncbi:Tat pathway signal protein [Psychromicrobium xiongbiense]|uniref:Tat pathway signal protein n=1 Tax=Psychromicrobium xiongbiense TaxID=3051184 RepID=UPI002553BA15|nr:Tat pathway signal protein [Psychromicrobium sp. YIM S02556]